GNRIGTNDNGFLRKSQRSREQHKKTTKKSSKIQRKKNILKTIPIIYKLTCILFIFAVQKKM
ncbi:MAG TPA: hypothetical protein PKK66_04685, partial [Bacteroidales bacterium]|nr:hypothetical protein [Bacteroidales bacterium]